MSDLPTVTLPRAPEPPVPFRFPVLATIAPVVVSVALWLVTGSAFALMFAALGPITAVASFADSRLGSRRTRRRERQRFVNELHATRSVIVRRHEIERSELNEAAPDAAAIVGNRAAAHTRWTRDAAVVTVGRGRVESTAKLEARTPPIRRDDEIERQLDELKSFADTVDDAPIIADGSLGIGVVGPERVALAVARGFAVQLAWTLAPSRFWCAGPEYGDPDGQWLGALPHRQGRGIQRGYRFEFGRSGSTDAFASIAVAESANALPGACRVVVQVGGDGAVAIVRHPERSARQPVSTVFVSRHDAVAWARDAAADATRLGLAEPHAALPSTVALAPLLGRSPVESPETLAATVGSTGMGALVLDLVRDGPHAVVGGTTGSGKSELLIAWVLSMAVAHPPERVTFLLVDFKGGAAFDALSGLPHTVGTITDLDAHAAARALASLRAELAHRERSIASAKARDIGGVGMPRLVIVVDEFAAMLAEHPDLHALFADLAARGRSLGVHLVLCTQRPAGVVRDAVLANADLRISLRVNNPGDSIAVVGTDAAAAIAVEHRGRAAVVVAGGPPLLAQFALAGPNDARAVAALWPDSPPPRRPWVEPLPGMVSRVEPDGDGTPFGMLDIPGEQRRGAAMWRERDGHVLVVGAPGSGKSSALRALGGIGAIALPRAVDAAWDALGELVARLDAPRAELTVVVDDLDALLARFAPDYRAEVVERLARVLREGPSHGIRVAIAAQRLAGDTQSLAGLVPARLWLRHASRQDLVMSGGDGATHDDRQPAGRGRWGGLLMQVVWREPSPALAAAMPVSVVDDAESVAIVSTRPAWLAERLVGQGVIVHLSEVGADPTVAFARGARTVLIGDVDDWQSRWGALAAVRGRAGILLHGCSVADYRALTRSRDLPPPLSSDPLLCWRLEPDATVSRVRLRA